MLGYTQYGDGQEKVMVVHGWKTDHTCFEALMSSLDAERFTFIFVDQRGYGKSSDLSGPFEVQQVAKDMVELADSLDWDRFHIVGHSMGGKVIQRIMADHPERIKSGIGITPCPACQIPFDDEGWQLFSSSDVNLENREKVFRLSTADRYTDNWYRKITQSSSGMSRAEAFRDYLDSWVNYDLVEDIQGCAVPVKVIVGENDPDLNLEAMRNTYQVWLKNCELVELKNCGHYPMFEAPLNLAAEIENFLVEHI